VIRVIHAPAAARAAVDDDEVKDRVPEGSQGPHPDSRFRPHDRLMVLRGTFPT